MELLLVNLRSFTSRQFNSEQVQNAKWPHLQGIRDGAMHSGLIILATREGRVSQLHSFLIGEELRSTRSPTLPENFFVHSISIDVQYIYISGFIFGAEFPWEIQIWDRENLHKVTNLTGPTPIKSLDVPDEWIQHMVTCKNLLVAVTPAGRLFFWDHDFAPLLDRSVTLTDDIMYEERYIDTVYLSQNLDRVVIMSLTAGCDTAMLLNNTLSLVPADSLSLKDTGMPKDYYNRVSADCQTAIRIIKSRYPSRANTPQLDIYPLQDKKPTFTIEPLSESLNSELGRFIDIYVNKYSITYLGTDGMVQVRFDNEEEDEAVLVANILQ